MTFTKTSNYTAILYPFLVTRVTPTELFLYQSLAVFHWKNVQTEGKFVPWSQMRSRGFLLFFIRKFCDANHFFLFFCWHEAPSREKKAPTPPPPPLWSRPLGTSLSCHQLLTVVSDWRIFLIGLLQQLVT